MEAKRERIKTWMAALMVATAGFIDLFNALLNFLLVGEILSSLISIAATTTFVIWFWILGVNFVKSPKKLAIMGGQALIGLVPILNTLPELTLGILFTIILTRSEDSGGIIGQATRLISKK